jgi:hypothetical protein
MRLDSAAAARPSTPLSARDGCRPGCSDRVLQPVRG